MGGLLDCLSIFFMLAHADDPDANKLLAAELMFLRKVAAWALCFFGMVGTPTTGLAAAS